MRRRSSDIYFPDENGNLVYCDEVIFENTYCDAIYKCDENGVMTCLWKKYIDEWDGVRLEIGGAKDYSSQPVLGNMAVYNNELYAIGNTYYSSGALKDRNAVFKFSFETRRWAYIASHQDAYDMTNTTYGHGLQTVFASELGIGKYSVVDKSIRFYGYTSSLYLPPEYYKNILADLGGTIITNKGRLVFKSNYVVHKDFDDEEINRSAEHEVNFVHNPVVIDGCVYHLSLVNEKYSLCKVRISSNGEITVIQEEASLEKKRIELESVDSVQLVVIGGNLYMEAMYKNPNTRIRTVLYYDRYFVLKHKFVNYIIIDKVDDTFLLARVDDSKTPGYKIGLLGEEITVNEMGGSFMTFGRERLSMHKIHGKYEVYYGTFRLNEDGTVDYKEKVTEIG